MTQFTPQPSAMVNPLALANPLFRLDYPQSIGSYTTYAEAQKAVDSLADQNFPVANLAIVGTDLKLIERVTGRKTWGTVIRQGLMSGLSTALMVALIMMIVSPGYDFMTLFVTALIMGVLIGVGFAALGHAMARGQRDFTSISQTIPSKFEVLCEHKVAAQARELLSRTPQARSAAFDPARQPAVYQGQPYQGQQPQPGYQVQQPQPGYQVQQPGYQTPQPGYPGVYQAGPQSAYPELPQVYPAGPQAASPDQSQQPQQPQQAFQGDEYSQSGYSAHPYSQAGGYSLPGYAQQPAEVGAGWPSPQQPTQADVASPEIQQPAEQAMAPSADRAEPPSGDQAAR